MTLVATLQGMTITIARAAAHRRPDDRPAPRSRGLPAGLTARPSEEPGGHLVVVLAAEDEDPLQAIARGREVLADLLRALRLFGDGRVTLGPLAWARIGGGAAGRPLPLGSGGRPHGMLVVTAEQEDELRAFCNLVSRRAPHGNELAWALRRFELGCERDSPSRGPHRQPAGAAGPARARGSRERPAARTPGGPLRHPRATHAADRAGHPGDRPRAFGDRRHRHPPRSARRPSRATSPTTCAPSCVT